MSTTDLVPANEVMVRPVMTVDQAYEQVMILRDYRSRVLREGVDYGKIPGVDKPSLWDSGAQKIANLFGLGIRHELANKIEDWAKGFFHYHYRAVLYRLGDGREIANAEGSCNSMEEKYRYRWYPEWDWEKIPEDERPPVADTQLRGKRGAKKYTFYAVERPAFGQVNTICKMAQKRARVGAVLVGTRASEDFTQDVEDAPPDDGASYEDVTTQPKQSDTPDAQPDLPTSAQIEFFQRLIKSHHVSDTDREKAQRWLEQTATKQSLTERIDKLKTYIEERNVEEKAAKAAAEETPSEGEAAPADDVLRELRKQELGVEVDEMLESEPADLSAKEQLTFENCRRLWTGFTRDVQTFETMDLSSVESVHKQLKAVMQRAKRKGKEG